MAALEKGRNFPNFPQSKLEYCAKPFVKNVQLLRSVLCRLYIVKLQGFFLMFVQFS